jgi:hypothetical protein
MLRSAAWNTFPRGPLQNDDCEVGRRGLEENILSILIDQGLFRLACSESLRSGLLREDSFQAFFAPACAEARSSETREQRSNEIYGDLSVGFWIEIDTDSLTLSPAHST